MQNDVQIKEINAIKTQLVSTETNLFKTGCKKEYWTKLRPLVNKAVLKILINVGVNGKNESLYLILLFSQVSWMSGKVSN